MHERSTVVTHTQWWLATVCPDGWPHLIPTWFVWLDKKFLAFNDIF